MYIPNNVDEVRFRTERVLLGVCLALGLEPDGGEPLGSLDAGGVVGRDEFDDTGVKSKGRRGVGRKIGAGSAILVESGQAFDMRRTESTVC